MLLSLGRLLSDRVADQRDELYSNCIFSRSSGLSDGLHSKGCDGKVAGNDWWCTTQSMVGALTVGRLVYAETKGRGKSTGIHVWKERWSASDPHRAVALCCFWAPSLGSRTRSTWTRRISSMRSPGGLMRHAVLVQCDRDRPTRLPPDPGGICINLGPLLWTPPRVAAG